MKIDILKMELEQKLPHWLSPRGRFSGRDAIRKKNREQWLIKQRAEREAALALRKSKGGDHA
jgi:hypothetical protein